MKTEFTPTQLQSDEIRLADEILRKCVHCGFCNATCPTFLLTGNELEGPRGRIYLIKSMLESGDEASADVVKHLDSCLTCLSCTTTCPSGVDYMHLIDKARTHGEETYTRPLGQRLQRAVLSRLVPNPGLFRIAMRLAQFPRAFAAVMPRSLRAWLDHVPQAVPAKSALDRPQVISPEGPRRLRVALHTGCVQQVLRPQINQATIRLLTRHGCEVVVPQGLACCGALVHHLGQESQSLAAARANVSALSKELDGEGLDAIIVNASGCGTHIKDYGYILRGDPAWAEAAAKVSALAIDVSEIYQQLDLHFRQIIDPPRVAYHSPCSLQHGQRIGDLPRRFLLEAGFDVTIPAEAHLCCGSAGTYNLLQPEMAATLGARKVNCLEATKPELIATGNIGCLSQFSKISDLPVVHTVELLDWATGGLSPLRDIKTL